MNGNLRGLLLDFDGMIAETERFGQRVAYNHAFAELRLAGIGTRRCMEIFSQWPVARSACVTTSNAVGRSCLMTPSHRD